MGMRAAVSSASVLSAQEAATRSRSVLPEASTGSWTSPWFKRGGGGSTSPWWNRGGGGSSSPSKSPFGSRGAPRWTRATHDDQRADSALPASPGVRGDRRVRRRRRPRSSSVQREEAAAPRAATLPLDSTRSTSTVVLKAAARRLVTDISELRERREAWKSGKVDPKKVAEGAQVHRKWVDEQRRKAQEQRNEHASGADQLFMQQATWACDTRAQPSRRSATTRAAGGGAAGRGRASHTTGASVEDFFQPKALGSSTFAGVGKEERSRSLGAINDRRRAMGKL
jgi:hypothetical protein